MAGLTLLKARLAALPRRVWLVGGAVILAAAALIGGLVLLPGFSAQWMTLDASHPTYLHPDGLMVSLPDGVETARVRITTIPREQFLSDQAGADWSAAHAALSERLTPLSPLYTLEVASGSVLAEMAIPNGADPLMLVDLYAWDARGEQWSYIPSRQRLDQQTIAFQPLGRSFTVMAVHIVPSTPTLGMIFGEGAPAIDAAYDVAIVDGVFINALGQLEGTPPQVDAAISMPLVANRMGGFSQYDDETSRNLMIENLMPLLIPYQGIVLDFDPQPGYVDFIAALSERVHAHGKQVEVVIRGGTSSYDVAGIAAAADRIWFAPGLDPNAFSANSQAAATLRSLVGQVDRSRLGLLVSERHVDVTGETAQPLTSAEALALFGDVQVGTDVVENLVAAPGSTLPFRLSGQVTSMGFDEALGTNYLTYTDAAGQLHYVYFASARSLTRKLEWTRSYGLGAVAVDGIAYLGAPPGIAEALTAYLNQQAPANPDSLAITWRVESSAGRSLDETSGDLSLIQYLWQAAAEPGSYIVSAVIQGLAGEASRGQVVVEVAENAPTPTPSPTPTATPTGRPPTATPDPNATPAPAPTAAPVTGGILAGTFELGGQTQSFGQAQQMQYAGMTWVKFQHKWNRGDDAAGAVGGRIADAHGRGFKVLLSIPGPEHPESIDYAAYVNFLGAVAALGPDAIEVWNEMNLPREWPANDINGGTYVTNMLAPAYAAIKAANPGVMVISGAPAPTGVYGGQGCGPLACDELLYIQQMRDAGAAQHADCIGIHYNEGIIPPSQSTGDPRDAYYTRYFFGMVNTYWATFGKPLCFTELGYLSPEGYGELPATFAWAGGTSVSEQAQWLAEAAVLSSQSSKVRLMIIFNVDFTVYGADPQGGYAIVRPGGGCPACDALNAVKP